MSGYAKRLLGTAIVTAALAGAIAVYVALYLTNVPGSSAAVSSASGSHLYLGTVAASKGTDPQPTWVSYYAVDSTSHHWVHSTTYVVHANSLLHITIYQYDGASGLRNPFLAQATGLVGGNFIDNGKPEQTIPPDSASHLFAIPQLGVSVPLQGVSANAKNQCANAPCPLSTAHNTISFTIRIPGKGLYRWQCFVPCAAGWIEGIGGPMQTVGYMDGFIKAV